ncbi:hypothetical protein GCM10010381_38670 [Streptomyces xantholiticus]|nr:hypothetical protein GCM10010381_38670 [Streptomyces xantholiticus]
MRVRRSSLAVRSAVVSASVPTKAPAAVPHAARERSFVAAEAVFSRVPVDVGPVPQMAVQGADRGPHATIVATVSVQVAQEDGGVQVLAAGGAYVAVAVP